jgi:hypothetical protein
MPERCDSCRLWRRLTAESGECHALAPQPVLYDPGVPATAPPQGGLRVAWPLTLASEMCGEWSPQPVRPGLPAPLPPEAPRCHAGRDGDCNWALCPQDRDGEPAATGRHCPLDTHDPDLEGR